MHTAEELHAWADTARKHHTGVDSDISFIIYEAYDRVCSACLVGQDPLHTLTHRIRTDKDPVARIIYRAAYTYLTGDKYNGTR